MGLNLSGNGSSETMYDEGDWNPTSDSRVGNSSVVEPEADDQSSLHCVTASTDVISDTIGRRDASRGVECSETELHCYQHSQVTASTVLIS